MYKMNKILKNLTSLNRIIQTTTSSYSKNTKTQRKKLPHEAAPSTKWVPNKKVAVIQEAKMDKNFLQRQVVDPVWLMKEYKPQMLKIEDAIQNHIDLAHESMFNNMNGFLHARLILDMTTKKKAKFMDNIKGAVCFPNHFEDGIAKEVIAICKNEAEIEAAKSAGALFAGYSDILKKFEKGEIADQTYDFLVCTPETFSDVMAIKKKIHKDKLPSLKTNTVVENIAEAVHRYHRSKDYESAKSSDEQGILKIKLGRLNMGVEKLTENLCAAIDKIKSHKKYAMDTFISDCVLYSPPSTEKFKVDLSRFTVVPEDEDDDDDVEVKQQTN